MKRSLVGITENQNSSVAPAQSTRQISPKDFIGVIIRRRWIILGIAIPIILVAILGTLNVSDSVTAATRVVLETQLPESTSFGTAKIDYDVLMATATQVVLSIPVAEAAAEAIWDSIPSYVEIFPEFALLENKEELRDYLMSIEDCGQVGETNILEINVSHPSGRFALLAVDAITDAYMDFWIDRQRNEPAVEYYTDQILQVEDGLRVLLDKRSEILKHYGLMAFQNNAQSYSAQIVEMERSYFDAKAERVGLERSYQSIMAAIENNPKFFPATSGAENTGIFRLNGLLNEEKVQLSKLRQQYMDDSEWVKRQEIVVEQIQAEINLTRDSYMLSLKIKLEESIALENELARAVARQKELVSLYPEINSKLTSVDVTIDSQRDLMEMLQVKRGEVRVKAATDSRVSNLILLNTPTISGFVGGSKKVIYIMMAAIFGLVLGLIAALFMDNQDHRIYDKYQVQEYLEIPVLGAISEVKGS